jgi:hypothetical protein
MFQNRWQWAKILKPWDQTLHVITRLWSAVNYSSVISTIALLFSGIALLFEAYPVDSGSAICSV